MTGSRGGAAWTAEAVRAALTLVAITDDLRDGVDGLVARALAAERGGISMLQVRLKAASSRELLRVTRALVAALQVPVLVNDRVDIALAAGAAGAHLGMDDLPIAQARRLVREGAASRLVLGVSLGSTADLAELDDADYVGVGPVFATPSKHDAGDALGVGGAADLARLAARPAVAIGGLDADNSADTVAAGFDGVSVIRAVLSQRDPEAAARQLREAVGRGMGGRSSGVPDGARHDARDSARDADRNADPNAPGQR